MVDYLAHRQNAIHEIPEHEINLWFDKMLKYLGGDIWLMKSSNNGHPIVKLWNRKDYMATNELINFAYAVNTMDEIDSRWTAQIMKEVSGKDINNAHGAIFEILALSLFSDSCQVIPAPKGYPGIDGTLKCEDGTKINLSLKYYGMSNAEQRFYKLMDSIEDELKRELECRNLLSAEVPLIFQKYPETPTEKSRIVKQLKLAIDEYELYGTRKPRPSIEDPMIIIRPIRGFSLSNSKTSSKIIAISPMHRNEYKNLRDKLDEACMNIRKHAPERNPNTKNCIMVHIHENADIDSYQEDMQQYIDDNSDDKDFPIDYIILYQALIACDRKGEYSIYHILRSAMNKRGLKKVGIEKVSLPNITFFVGKREAETFKNILFAGETELFNLNNVYLYQKGDIFEKYQNNSDDSVFGRLKMLAPGIRVNPVLPIPDGKMIIPQLITFENTHLEIS